MIEIYAFLDDCINCFRDVDDVLCKQCECVLGRIVEDTNGISVKFFNFRLVEYHPVQAGVETSQRMFINRSIEFSNHLKRKSNSTMDEDEPLPKCPCPNNKEPVCLMRVSVPTIGISPLFSMPEFDFEDTFDEVDQFVDDMDIDLDSIVPLPSSSFIFEIPHVNNWFTNLPPITENENAADTLFPAFDSDVETVSDDDDSDVEYVPQTPPGII